ncbi:ABC transporter permease [Gardnerella vaginalis]|uniref:ABC transporter permease n=1 Tax=Gardnerella vaginalis TaxID=2702 RepID=UPI00041FDB4D|nr:ABC transporter permease [Gardnerella vaginalis]
MNNLFSAIAKLHRKAFTSLKAWLSTIAILFLWFLITLTPAENRALPSPSEVIKAFVDLNNEGILLPSLAISIFRVVAGLLLGIAFALPSGIISGGSKIGESVINKPSHMLRSIPFPALAPLLIIFLGVDEMMKIMLIALGVFGPMYVNIRDGVRNIDPKLIELAKAYNVKKSTVFTTIFMRGTLANFMTGLRFSISVAWVALVTCETVNSSIGIGYILSRAQQFFRPDQMMACIILYAIAGLGSEVTANIFEYWLMPERRVNRES